jgi:hypothetical protein
MPAGTTQSLRLAFKRAFTAYLFQLESPGIADPTEAFDAARSYLAVLRERLGDAELMSRLDDETTQLADQVEQDLRRRFGGRADHPAYEDIEDRLRECFEYGLSQLTAGEHPIR